ncbi:unnamed protein product [Brassica napus]|uniref:(rape) hypothetical protein n=1 Tax=Brassica napus TaxID=3708 RepID=A0A816KJY8_BRANA|nr:unnamed protein product [Brassica napus]
MLFLDFSFVLFTPQVHNIHENAINFFFIFFPKMTFLLSHPHHHQVITRLSLSSIPQPP